jgi:hypothetical protein
MKSFASLMKTWALVGTCVGLAAAGGVAAGPQQNPAAGPFATKAKVVVKTQDGDKVIPLKREEQIAVKFAGTIDALERNCGFYAAEPCTLEALIRRPNPRTLTIPSASSSPTRTPRTRTTRTKSSSAAAANGRSGPIRANRASEASTLRKGCTAERGTTPSARPPRRTRASARPQLTWISACDNNAGVLPLTREQAALARRPSRLIGRSA